MRDIDIERIRKHGLNPEDFQPHKEQTTIEELEEALVEIAQNQSDLEDALVELAEMIGG